MLKIALTGAAGRMGRALTEALAGETDLALCGALVRAGSPAVGREVPMPETAGSAGVRFSDDLAAVVKDADVVIDFSNPALTREVAAACADAGKPLVTGTTGLDAGDRERLEAAAARIPLVLAPNMSVGVNLALRLIETAARVLGEEYDLEIQEAHHRHKIDAPSGTALRMGEVAARARGRELADCAVHERHGQTGGRPAGSIGFAVTRAGDIVGEHTVLFAGTGERLEIVHKATSRQNFARGALRAARWIGGRRPGLYSMQDVLGL